MAIGKEIKVVLTLDDKGYSVGVRNASGALKQFGHRAEETAKSVRNIENHFTSLGGRAHRIVTTMGMARFAIMDLRDIFLSLPLAVMKSSGEIERMTKLMEGLSKETDAAKRQLEGASNVKFVFDMAQNAPFEVKALGDAFVKLKTGGIDPTNGSLQALVDGVARFGGSSDQLKRASIAIQQMAGKGVISMEELRQQLGEAVPTAMQSMATGMSMTMAELANKVSKGTVAATGAISKMLAVMHVDNAGAAGAMMDTWVGMLERLKTKWELFKLEIGGEGMFEGAKAALDDLLKVMDGDAGGSFARNIGGTLNDATESVIGLTKSIVEMWDWIKLSGQAMLLYWGASKVAPGLKAMSDGINMAVSRMRYLSDFTAATAENDMRDRRKAINSNAEFLERKIKQNNTEIAAEVATEQKRRAIRRDAIAKQMADNNQSIAMYESARARQIQAERALLANPAFATRNMPGMQTQADRDQLRMLDLQVEKQREAAKATQEFIDKKRLANVALREESNLLRTGSIGLSTHAMALQATNGHLQAAVGKYQEKARAVTAVNAAMLGMRNAATSVIGSIKSIMFSMNGLIMVIMAAVWAWDHFSSKARQAAKDADIAFNAKQRLERGGATEDTLKASSRNITAKKTEVSELDEQIKFFALDAKMSKRAAQEQEKRIALRRTLVLQIAQAETDFNQETAQLQSKRAMSDANDLVQVTKDAANKAVSAIAKNQAEIEQKYLDLAKANKGGKLTGAQEQSRLAEQLNNRRSALAGEKAVFQKQIAEYRNNAKLAGLTAEEREKYETAVNGLVREVSNVNQQLLNLDAPNDINAGDPKKKPGGGGASKLDSVIRGLARENIALATAKQRLASVIAGVSDVEALKAEATARVDALIESDAISGRVKKHTPAERAELIANMTDAVAIETAIKEMETLQVRMADAKAKQDAARAKLESGDYQKNTDQTETQKMIAYLGRLSAASLEAAQAFAPIIAEYRKLEAIANDVDTKNNIMDNEVQIAALRISTITDTRARIEAQNAKEVADLERKYARQIQLAGASGEDVNRLMKLNLDERELLAKQHFENMKSPIDRLADQWAKTTEAMEQSTAKWAGDGIDELVKFTTTGKAEFGSFVTSILTDMLRIRMQETMGKAVSGAMGKAGEFALNLFNGGAAQAPAAGATAAAGAGDAATPALKAVGDAATVASQSMTSLSQDGVAKMTMSAVQSVLASTTKMTVEATASAAMMMMATAADLSTASLWQLSAAAQAASAAQGASVASSFFANGGIMSSSGSLPLKMYSNGGIANSPQLAVYGEGRMNEAYVPLPDGRTIPVTMQGGQQAAAPNVQVNVINQTGQQMNSQQGQARFDGKQMILDVVLTAASQPGGFRDGMKSAMKG